MLLVDVLIMYSNSFLNFIEQQKFQKKKLLDLAKIEAHEQIRCLNKPDSHKAIK